MHAHTHARMYARMHTRTHTCTHACMHARTHTHTHTHVTATSATHYILHTNKLCPTHDFIMQASPYHNIISCTITSPAPLQHYIMHCHKPRPLKHYDILQCNISIKVLTENISSSSSFLAIMSLSCSPSGISPTLHRHHLLL